MTGAAQLRQLFLGAAVVSTEITGYLNDGQQGIYTETQALQKFPAGDGRDFVWTQSYVDGLSLARETVQESGQSSGNVITLMNYDGAGNPVLQSLPFFSPSSVVSSAPHAVLLTYDVLGRIIQRQDPAGAEGNTYSTSTWLYGMAGSVKVTLAADSEAAYTQIQQHHFFDSQDQVRRIVVPTDNNATTAYEFDRIARMVRATDPATKSNPSGVSNVTTYDSLDRKLTVDNPDQNTTGNPQIKAATYQYDASTGFLRRQTDAAQKSILYSYDAMGRQTGQSFSDGSKVSLVYDAGGQMSRGHLTEVTMTAPDGTQESRYAMGYDQYGNKSQLTTTIGEQSFNSRTLFDPQRRPVEETQPDQRMIVSQYAFNHLVQLTLGDVQAVYPLEYFHPTGKAGRLLYGTGSVEGGAVAIDYTFNPAGQVYRETVANGGGTVLDDTYEYDLLNQILKIGDSQSYLYVNQRLVNAVASGFSPAAFAYDESSNLTQKEGVDYEFHAHFAWRGTNGGTEVYAATPDACGRTASRTAGGIKQLFEYDPLGYLRRVATADGSTINAILNDYHGWRLRETDQRGAVALFVSPSYQVVQANGEAPKVVIYLRDARGPVASIGPSAEYLRLDHKTSVTHVFAADGALTTVLGYAAYGEFTLLSGSTAPALTYENRPLDSGSGLFYFGARYYDAVSGRFLTPDTGAGGTSLYQAGILNRYCFELNNPIRFVDPTGHMAAWVGGLLIGLTIAAVGVLVVATAGTAAPLVGLIGAGAASFAASVVGGALIAGGIGAASYAIAYRDNFSWKDYGIHLGISAAVGAVSGGLFYGLGAATQGMTLARSLLASTVGSSFISGASDVLGQLATNAAEGKPLDSGLVASAVFGMAFGAAGGFLGTGAGRLNEAGATSVVDSRVPDMLQTAQQEFNATNNPVIQALDTQSPISFFPVHPGEVVEGLRQAQIDGLINHPLAKAIVQISSSSASFPEAYLEDRNWPWGS